MIIIPGSINADLLFPVQTLPAPGETVLCPSYTMAPGGKGANQAAAAAKAGAEVRFIGHVGDDAYGPVVRQLLADAGVEVAGLAVSPRPTAVAVIGVDAHGENQIIVASGANLDTHAGQVPDELLGPGTTLLCQNEIRTEESFRALLRGRARRARTILNLAPATSLPGEVLDALDLLVVNELEARTAARAGAGDGDARALAERLVAGRDLAVVVTLGAKGAIALQAGKLLKVGALPVDPVDTTGAGDAFTGVLAACLDRGLGLELALHRAAVGAALACERLGAQSAQPTLAEIEARAGQLPMPESLG
ncbi:PfkB family carbohydrate kinase [Geminicoccus harenae]|uniref:PfkB family carbohydrate kinase n=2 Tax=Geminicoccus harenae TaxID=2498453 RepID=UPI001C95D0A6|nr:PfkB family carbohydrate kinase [Geminicoccus harenae]